MTYRLTRHGHTTVRETTGPGDAPRADDDPREPGSIAGRLLFPLGRLVATPGALRAFEAAEASPVYYLARHATGDWGDVDAEDRAANDRALRTGERLLSAYRLPTGVRVWCITEADRSATTLLLPSEY